MFCTLPFYQTLQHTGKACGGELEAQCDSQLVVLEEQTLVAQGEVKTGQ
jgi:hypothetical protein